MESLLDHSAFVINGDDWPTADGTCVRDYVHVRDIADAHVLGAKWLLTNPGFHVMNIGSGSGQSIRQIVAAVEYVTGRRVNTITGPKRAGDPAWRMADINRISATLNWKPNNDLVSIVSDAYDWYNSNTFKKLRC
jgi:UDP-glucose 4-epimerase